MTDDLTLIDGKLHLYKRDGSPRWQCSAFLSGRNHRSSTKTDDLERAKIVAEEWYFSMRLKQRAGELVRGGYLFKDAAAKFFPEYQALTAGERNARYVDSMQDRLRVHLLPFFGNTPVTEITSGMVQDYRVHRMTSRKDPKTGEIKRPARSTLHHEIVTLRHVLKTAERLGWIKYIPNLAAPYRASGKVSHRAWFSLDEYKTLYKATGERAKNPLNPRWKWESEQLHDFVLFMVNTGLRPDEAVRLEFRDVEIVEDGGDRILEISVRGKRGTGYCKSMPGAVLPFERLRERPRLADETASRRRRKLNPDDLVLPKKTDRLFPSSHRQLFNTILDELKLKSDREGLKRSAYSLRHTYICLRLMEGADIYQIAKNCRTSVEMIEKFYAAHIKNMIDAAAVNVRRGRPDEPSPKRKANAKRAPADKSGGYPKRRR